MEYKYYLALAIASPLALIAYIIALGLYPLVWSNYFTST